MADGTKEMRETTPYDFSGEWFGHIGTNPAKFKFDKAPLCGWVGQYKFPDTLTKTNVWITITKITYKDSYLTLETNIGKCEGYMAVNVIHGKYSPSNIVAPTVAIGPGPGQAPLTRPPSIWTMYR
jgi:hypothetical protein